MQSAAGPPGGSNPKRATGRSHRSAGGASPAALDRSPRVVARPAHAHVLASTAAFGGAICAFIALWILLAPIGLFPTVGGAHSVHFESDSLFGRHALRQKARLQRGTTIVLRCCSLTFPTALALAHFGLPLLAFGELFSALLPRQFAGTVELEYPLLDASAVKLDLM
ncbi:hypothetical protein EMIHUDRAFT_237400 [Emiliania huxleyi CCMP1516]|nr:hypothetical protein EMIHUDRAFT_237400 [Emiliania huxleyi CCMP1516]EOD25627.1 hypothetical protein EMIHUDRAFT_237400 [Emiliania huxleyi CCMP1516]|eukprot:XP_005778056.1 hypothetical protein EMIHUDRAFT_237400 [Emiliania huxleyi CCMP1516]